MLYKDDSTQTGSVLFGGIIWRWSLTCNLGLLSLWFFSETSSKKTSVAVTPTGGASPSFTITTCFLSVFWSCCSPSCFTCWGCGASTGGCCGTARPLPSGSRKVSQHRRSQDPYEMLRWRLFIGLATQKAIFASGFLLFVPLNHWRSRLPRVWDTAGLWKRGKTGSTWLSLIRQYLPKIMCFIFNIALLCVMGQAKTCQ